MILSPRHDRDHNKNRTTGVRIPHRQHLHTKRILWKHIQEVYSKIPENERQKEIDELRRSVFRTSTNEGEHQLIIPIAAFVNRISQSLHAETRYSDQTRTCIFVTTTRLAVLPASQMEVNYSFSYSFPMYMETYIPLFSGTLIFKYRCIKVAGWVSICLGVSKFLLHRPHPHINDFGVHSLLGKSCIHRCSDSNTLLNSRW